MPSWTSHLCFSTSRKIIIINWFWIFFVYVCVCVFIILMLMSQPSHLRSLIWQSVFKSCTRVVHSVMLWSFDWPFWHYFHLALLSLFVLQKNQSVHFLCWIIFLALWRVEGMKKCTDSFTIIFTFHMPRLFAFCIASSFSFATFFSFLKPPFSTCSKN